MVGPGDVALVETPLSATVETPLSATSTSSAGVTAAAAAVAVDATRPILPCSEYRLGDPEWNCIDPVHTESLISSPLPHLNDVPATLTTAWARAIAFILTEFFHCQVISDMDGMTRALKWYLAIHDILLRRGRAQRGGRRAARTHTEVAKRFLLWEQKEYGQLLRHWVADREYAAATAHRRKRRSSPEAEIQHAVNLAAEGELSKATSLLVSNGIADCSDHRVMARLRALHPQRVIDMPEVYSSPHPILDFKLKYTMTLRNLRRRAGTGPDGLRNEYLTALTQTFDDPAAAKVMSLVDQFYNDIVNARLPPWFYFVTTAVLLVPLKKSNANDGAVRPLGIGNAARRAMARCVTASVRVEMSEKLAPEQLGVAVPYGSHCLAAGVREERQLEPDKVWAHLARRGERLQQYGSQRDRRMSR